MGGVGRLCKYNEMNLGAQKIVTLEKWSNSVDQIEANVRLEVRSDGGPHGSDNSTWGHN
jgi:hypothetical protein